MCLILNLCFLLEVYGLTKVNSIFSSTRRHICTMCTYYCFLFSYSHFSPCLLLVFVYVLIFNLIKTIEVVALLLIEREEDYAHTKPDIYWSLSSCICDVNAKWWPDFKCSHFLIFLMKSIHYKILFFCYEWWSLASWELGCFIYCI